MRYLITNKDAFTAVKTANKIVAVAWASGTIGNHIANTRTTVDAMMAVAVLPDGTLGAPRRLFEWKRQLEDRFFRSYDISLDGERFLLTRRDPGAVPTQLNVILNWADE